MRTQSWAPPAAVAYSDEPVSNSVRLDEKLYYEEKGQAPTEYSLLSALYIAYCALRSDTYFRITRGDGSEVCVNNAMGLSVQEDFSNALVILEKVAIQERAEGMTEAVADMDRRIAAAEAAASQFGESSSARRESSQPGPGKNKGPRPTQPR